MMGAHASPPDGAGGVAPVSPVCAAAAGVAADSVSGDGVTFPRVSDGVVTDTVTR